MIGVILDGLSRIMNILSFGMKLHAEIMEVDEQKSAVKSSSSDSIEIAHYHLEGDSSNNLALNVLSNLIDLGVVDIFTYGSSHAERTNNIIRNFDTFKAKIFISIQENLQNPLLDHVMNKAGLSIDQIEKLMNEIDADIIRDLNLGDVRVIDQRPFHVRSIYPQLESKDQLHSDMDFMRAKNKRMKTEFENDILQLNAANKNRLMMFHSDPSPHVDVLGIGRGNNQSRYWEYMPNKHEQNALFVGQNNGIWQGNYQLAQTSGVLEFDADTAASNYNPAISESFGVSQVNARHLYKGMIHSQVIHNFPGIPGEVMNVRKANGDGYLIQVAYRLNGQNHVKTVHANQIVVGTGLSDAKNIFSQHGQFYREDFKTIVGDRSEEVYRLLVKGGYFHDSGRTTNKQPNLLDLNDLLKNSCEKDQISTIAKLIESVNAGRSLGSLLNQSDYKRLSTFDQKKGFTPIVDGNAFILSDKECSSLGEGRRIMVWGGGGTAAAATRRGLFLQDTPDIKMTPETYQHRKNDVIWIARNGFDTLRDGTLAVDAKSTLGQTGNLWPNCELVAIKSLANGKLQITIDRYRPAETSADPKTVIMRKIEGVELACIREREVVEVDQLVYSLGQENRGIEQIFDGIDISANTIDMVRDKEMNVPLYGTLKGHPDIQFHGAALTAGTLGAKSANIMEEVVTSENIPPDVGPGSMPLAWSTIRASHFSNSGVYYPSVNASIDYRALIDKHLQSWGITDPAVRSAFLDDIVQHRTDTRGGIPASSINMLLEKHDLKHLLTIDGAGMLKPLQIRSKL
ncbi:hypothetical protein EO087_06230 [Dyella sp. M7H15-1]|uniref:hypothetical protein n=1 Tax=Dyella sp. M7H15-1 TaxID=2501295 RepID=UPI0010051029|nr:hypothetical protein [Dyella sp. M7H15-1]QAU23628.1 hypothetical protein EO087_06230 [Dyella sp. M7H15-1]